MSSIWDVCGNSMGSILDLCGTYVGTIWDLCEKKYLEPNKCQNNLQAQPYPTKIPFLSISNQTQIVITRGLNRKKLI